MPEPQDEPTWQPISQLPLIAWAIDGMAESAEEQVANLEQARARPHVLDLPTIGRTLAVYGQQQGDLWLYREQLRRWGLLTLTQAQRAEVARLEQRLAQLTTHIDAILAFAQQVRPQTIESILSRADIALALDVLEGKLRPPR